MKLDQQRVKKFQTFIFSWWKTHKRDLPWRHTHDPYKIFVSEVMLQQTQVLRVIAKYREFIERYPTVYDLAQASSAEVLRMWKGMGYNRRALYLKKTAQVIVEQYQGIFPKNEKDLCSLPGLGTYTARAILVFAYRENITIVDTNIRQIITHFFFSDILQKESLIDEVADQLLPKGKSWEWHQALMDYGALRLARPCSGQALRRSFTLRNECASQGKRSNKSRLKIPFRESNRFYRGRIMDRLREGDIHQSDLIKEFTGTYGKSEDFILMILQGLEADGLISRLQSGIVCLPE
ncbi:hypothetical protein HYV22_01340 [Candidatus Gottesmanbacteria bacterium]|nr:hypothetical protein [Candidatus Gottesmanbacteria bacterium]